MHSEQTKPLMLRYGWLKPLPDDYVGERHVVIVKREPTGTPNLEWCEFEERPGPAPAGPEDDACTVYLTRDSCLGVSKGRTDSDLDTPASRGTVS